MKITDFVLLLVLIISIVTVPVLAGYDSGYGYDDDYYPHPTYTPSQITSISTSIVVGGNDMLVPVYQYPDTKALTKTDCRCSHGCTCFRNCHLAPPVNCGQPTTTVIYPPVTPAMTTTYTVNPTMVKEGDCAPLIIHLADQSYATNGVVPVDWKWDISTGETLYGSEVTYTISNPGTYTLTETVAFSDGYIEASPPAQLTVQNCQTAPVPASGQVPEMVQAPLNPELAGFPGFGVDMENNFGYVPVSVDLSYLNGMTIFGNFGSLIATGIPGTIPAGYNTAAVSQIIQTSSITGTAGTAGSAGTTGMTGTAGTSGMSGTDESIAGLFPFSLPSRFSLVEEGRSTPVKDQGDCGSCWIFATMGSLESNQLPGEQLDLSENNLKTHRLWDGGQCDGGNGMLSLAYLTRWNGAANEADDPYNPGPSNPVSVAPEVHVQEVMIIPDKQGPEGLMNLKLAVMLYGGVMTRMYATKEWQQAGNGDWYFYDGDEKPNHQVVIEGWDDAYQVPGYPPGAFLVRNSWGPDWGNNGYFWASYYDKYIGTENFLFNNAEPVANYDMIYSYDPYGWTGNMGFGSPVGWFANVYTAQADELIKGVGFVCSEAGSYKVVNTGGQMQVLPVPPSSYEIYVFTRAAAGPMSGTLVSQKTGTISIPGYYTIPIDPVPVAAGEPFSVVVKVTEPFNDYPIPIENMIPGMTSGAASAPGQSYVSSDGTYWEDLTANPAYQNANVILKAYTEVVGGAWPSGGPTPASQPTITVQPTITPGDELTPEEDAWGTPYYQIANGNNNQN